MAPSPDPVWRLGPGLDEFAALVPDDENDFDRLEPLDGSPMAAAWEPLAVHWSTAGGLPVPDYTSLEAPVFTQRALDALGDLVGGAAEALALDVAGGPPARLLNVTRLSDALDEDASEIKRFPDVRFMRAVTPVFDPARLEGHTIFKLRQSPRGEVFVTGAVAERLREAGLEGVDLRPAWPA